jgi:hypothetical protein
MAYGYWVVSGRVRAGYLGLYIYIYILFNYILSGGRVSTRPKFQKPLSVRYPDI